MAQSMIREVGVSSEITRGTPPIVSAWTIGGCAASKTKVSCETMDGLRQDSERGCNPRLLIILASVPIRQS